MLKNVARREQREHSVQSSRLRLLYGLICMALMGVLLLPAHAQQLTGTLSGTALDEGGAVIAGAQITLKNEASGDIRKTVTDGSGYFTVPGVQPATYTLTVTAKGFQTWQEHGIPMNLGDNRTVPEIKLSVGKVSDTVEVVSGANATIPMDTAEVSTTLNETMISNIALEGRNAGELIKLMPGMALNNGLNQGSGFNAQAIGNNTGPAGNYASNGAQPYGALAYMLDGANLVDPGNGGTQIANINPDMTSQIKVLQSSYDAEYAKGPTIFEAFSKSGGAQFHGEAYLYARNSAFNSWNSYAKSQYVANPSLAPGTLNPSSSYYYPGAQIGGPVIIPHTGFNHNRDKMFFWFGYEYMKQNPAATPVDYNVPTADQLAGNFSTANVPAGALSAWAAAYTPPCANAATPLAGCTNGNYPGNASSITIPTADFDPNIAGFLKLYPTPNITPSASNGWSNYLYVESAPQNRWEADAKLDYSINDNNKLSGSYIRQNEKDVHPIAIWWQQPWTLPWPGGVSANTNSQVILANYTHVFNASTTNEVLFSYARYINPNTENNPSATYRSTLGFNTSGLFNNTTKQMPDVIDPSNGSLPNLTNYDFNNGFEGDAFGGIKTYDSISDNFTKVIGKHTVKAGFYWDTNQNLQSQTSAGNGQYSIANYGTYTTGNVVADLELGHIQSYAQQSSTPVETIKFHEWSLWAQDSWNVTRKLTVNYGLRLDHVGQWYLGTGMQVWDSANYNNSAGAPANTGLEWHSIDSSVPLSGFKSPLYYYDPRLGVSYDIFGTGKTVVRAGLGLFRYSLAVNDVGNPAAGPMGSFQYSTPIGFIGYSNLTSFTPPTSSSESGPGSNVYAMQMGDGKMPTTVDWNLTVDQALPWHIVVEASYVGNKSTQELINGSNSNLENLNNIPAGAFFGPDPKTGVVTSPSSASFNANDYRPLNNYQNVYIITHGSSANYHALQTSLQKQSGPLLFLTNYTYSKTMGIRDGESDNGNGNGTAVDPYNLKANYGPLAYDHTQIFNSAIISRLPNFAHQNALFESAVNGWTISGTVQFQSGAPIQPNTGGDLNVEYPGNNPVTLQNGLVAAGTSTTTWLGTSTYNDLVPLVTCNPKANLAKGYYFNPNCFAPPPQGSQGTLIWPYIHGPAYFDTDLALYKTFKITERQNIQFRVDATNWLNHPLRQFGLAGNSDEELSFIGPNDASGNQTLSSTNTNTQTTGKPAFTTGQRVLLFAAKYSF
jgi:hypothetical protein